MAIKINGTTVINDSQAITSTSTISATGNVTGGNVVTAGIISATGNISTGGTITATTIVANVTPPAGGAISTTGNVTGNYILGNGALLTGVITSVANINSGTSNVTVVSSGGNVTVGVGGTSNVAVFATTGEYVTGVVSASGNVSGGNILTGGLISSTGSSVAGSYSTTGNVSGGNVNTNTIVGTALALKSTGALSLSTTGNVVVNSAYINGVLNPVQDQDVATKIYVDNFATTGIAYHSPVVAATNTTLATATGGTITYTQPNGAANGIGALLTTTGSFNLIDTANVQTLGTRILVKNEANAVLNGVYTWANATNIIRSTDTDEYGADSVTALSINDYFFVSSGNVNAGSAWVVNAPTSTITFGTSNITFAQFSSSQVYSASTGLTLNGTVFSVNASQTQITSVGTLGSLAVTANVAGGNLTTAGQVSATSNITGGNVLTGGIVSATGNIAAPYFIGNGSALTGLSASKIFNGTSEANIGTSGGNANISIGGTSNVFVVATTGIYTTGLSSVTGNITAGNYLTAGLISAGGTVTGTSHLGAVVSVTANVTGGNLLTAGIMSAGGNIFAANIIVTGGFYDTGDHLVTSTAANANIILTPTGTGTTQNNGAFSASGNILTAGIMSSTGNAIHGNVLTAGLISAGGTVTGTSHLGAVVSVTGAITGAAITGSSLTVTTGNVTLGNIVNANGNAVGNIGSSSNYFNTIFGKATTAQYADLAENYLADAVYVPGTVLDFDGAQEVTLSTRDSSKRVAGVVSTNPAHLMNSTLDGAHVTAVALVGRVPTQVTGTIAKGDLMVSAGNGRARAEANPATGTVIGKALENFDGSEGTIEIVISMQ